MNRRRFLSSGVSAFAAAPWLASWCIPSLAALAATLPVDAHADAGLLADAGRLADGNKRVRSSAAGRVLILVELRGGNDGLNTVVPVKDPLYRRLRPTLAISPNQLLRLDAQRGLHPALASLMPLWERGEVAIVEGIGVSQTTPATSTIVTTATATATATATVAHASHFRAIRIWESGSGASEYRKGNWFDAATDVAPLFQQGFTLNFGFGPAFSTDQAGLGRGVNRRRNVDGETRRVSARFTERAGAVADAIVSGRADGPGVRFARLTLDGFDTHHRQAARHAELLAELAAGIATMRTRLTAAGRWDDVAVMTTSDFGRSVAENGDGGTDHGGAAPHFVIGGRVQGGVAGSVAALPADGGVIVPVVDARRLYATVLDQWLDVPSAGVLGRQFETLPLFV